MASSETSRKPSAPEWWIVACQNDRVVAAVYYCADDLFLGSSGALGMGVNLGGIPPGSYTAETKALFVVSNRLPSAGAGMAYWRRYVGTLEDSSSLGIAGVRSPLHQLPDTNRPAPRRTLPRPATRTRRMTYGIPLCLHPRLISSTDLRFRFDGSIFPLPRLHSSSNGKTDTFSYAL